MATLKPKRLAVIDDVVATIKARIPAVRRADYDVPFDFSRDECRAYVFDFDETYDVGDRHGKLFNTMSVAVVIAFEYGEGERSLHRLGNRHVADVIAALLADVGRGGTAFDTMPTSSAIQDLAAQCEHLGAVTVHFDIRYIVPFGQPYAAAA